MQSYTIKRDNLPDVKFTGGLIGNASSRNDKSIGRWTELLAYITESGKLVLVTVGASVWEGETHRYTVEIIPADMKDIQRTALIKHFGHGWLAKALYNNMNIADEEEI